MVGNGLAAYEHRAGALLYATVVAVVVSGCASQPVGNIKLDAGTVVVSEEDWSGLHALITGARVSFVDGCLGFDLDPSLTSIPRFIAVFPPGTIVLEDHQTVNVPSGGALKAGDIVDVSGGMDTEPDRADSPYTLPESCTGTPVWLAGEVS